MTKRNKIVYWISTIWLALGMLSTGTLQLFKVKAEGAVSPPGVYGITHLGYPVYFLTILGAWKILGVVALLIPKFPLLKEWAYAGFFFAMSGAVFSHIASGDSMTENVPALLLLILTVLSWYFRPADRKIISVNQNGQGQEFGSPKTATDKHGNHAAVGA
jgi:DoxX-like family